MGYQSTKDAIDRLLIRMKLDYLDMYLIHHPLGDYVGSWTAMEEAVKAGKITKELYQKRQELGDEEFRKYIRTCLMKKE